MTMLKNGILIFGHIFVPVELHLPVSTYCSSKCGSLFTSPYLVVHVAISIPVSAWLNINIAIFIPVLTWEKAGAAALSRRRGSPPRGRSALWASDVITLPRRPSGQSLRYLCVDSSFNSWAAKSLITRTRWTFSFRYEKRSENNCLSIIRKF
jgi:hypothetical protein